MKKQISTLLVFFVLSFTCNSAFSQNYYATPLIGYNLSGPGEPIALNQTVNFTNAEIYTYENVNGTFGAGLNFGANVGYMFNEHIGAEMGFSYLMSSSYVTTFSGNSTSSTSSAYLSETDSLTATMIRIIPAVVVSSGNSSVSPYAKFGLVIRLAGKITNNASAYSNASSAANSTSKEGRATYEYSGGSSFGWMGAFGLGFKINDVFRVNTEVTMINQVWGPERKTNTDKTGNIFTANGTSGLDSPVTLSDTYTTSSSNNGPRTTDLKHYFSFSSFGLNVGLQIKFGAKK